MRIRILVILFLSFIFKTQSQPLSSDGDYTNIKIGVINCKDTLNFIQHQDYKITSLNNKFVVDVFILKNGIETNYNEKSGARSIDFTDDSKHQYFVSRYYSKESFLKVIISKKRKKMIVIFKINKHRDYLPWNIKIIVPFRKGIYEVRNPENPKLVKIKK